MNLRSNSGFKRRIRNLLKRIYYRIPYIHRSTVVGILFRIPLARSLLRTFVLNEEKPGTIAGPLLPKKPEDLFVQNEQSFNVDKVSDLKPFKAHAGIENSNRIGVVIHAYYPDLLPSLLEALKNIPCEFTLYITTTANYIDQVTSMASHHGAAAEVIEVENSGYDLLPFLNLISRFVQDDIDIICKLHTKKGGANLEHLYPDIGSAWSDLLVNPILGSAKTVTDIIIAFEQDPNLGMVGSASLYKSAQNLIYGNQADVAQIISTLGVERTSKSDWGFFAGSMFWIRAACLEPLLKLIGAFKISCKEDSGQVASFWHALERVLGLLPQWQEMRTGLSFIADGENSRHVIAIPEQGALASYANSAAVGQTLVSELNVHDDAAILYEYTVDTTCLSSNAQQLKIQPVLYYLRYGVFLGEELVESFNSPVYWHTYKDVMDERLNPFVHYVRKGRSEGRISFPAQDNADAAYKIIADSGLFDSRYYLSENPDVAVYHDDPLRHFCERGWLEQRDPSKGFDLWDYWQKYLDPKRALINPLIHKILLEKDSPARRIKTDIQLSDGYEFKPDSEIRRICLFAGYDPDDRVDQVVIDYIGELSRYADVYYLSDGEMLQSELDKLRSVTKQAWSILHGEYDFGSYARLALDLIGWDVIEEYDELILANDSCYLINSFAPVFEKMQSAKCDWWGLQATKGISKTRGKKSNRFSSPIPLTKVKSNMLSQFEEEEFYDFLVASYFLVFRSPVLKGPELRAVLGAVGPEPSKLNIIRKYEIGLTRELIRAGYNFETFIADLYPFHPIYTEFCFELISKGFPLFKRFLLTDNHYLVPDLWQWEEKLRNMSPDLNLDPIKSNLERVASPENLHRNLNIKTLPFLGKAYPKLFSRSSFALRDKLSEKNANWWAFPVCAYEHRLTGNDRAVFEAVKDDSSIKKIVLVRDKQFEGHGENVEVVPLDSRAGQELLLKSGVVFIKHTVGVNIGHPLETKSRLIINLWHGVPIKRIGYASRDLQDRKSYIERIHSQFDAVICSSEIDRMAMTCSFYPLNYNDFWVTGLPRIDFVIMDEERLPPDMLRELHMLDELLAGRHLVFFCPTFRNTQDEANYQFTCEEKASLNQLLRDQNAVLGVREHMAAKTGSYIKQLSGVPVISLSNKKFSNVELIYRRTTVMVTDYSSCLIDFMVTGKPIILFAYDYDYYAAKERGLYYDLPAAVPGPVCNTFDSLLSSLSSALNDFDFLVSPDVYAVKRRVFHKFLDAENSKRLVNKLKETSNWRGVDQ